MLFDIFCPCIQDKAHQAKQEGKGLLGTAQDKVNSFLGTSQSKAEDAKDTAQVFAVLCRIMSLCGCYLYVTFFPNITLNNCRHARAVGYSVNLLQCETKPV